MEKFPDQKKTTFGLLVKGCFYGNYFYGICAVAQVLETCMQLYLPVNNWWLYGVTFLATVLFYNYPYARSSQLTAYNSRTRWYHTHHRFLRKSQLAFTIALIILGGWYIHLNSSILLNMDPAKWFLLLVFPVISALYYGANILSFKFNLRRAGWLKPFLIGFAWAGITVAYPILFYHIANETPVEYSFRACMLFFKSFMFVSVLAILFDIKDYAVDSQSRLSTLVVRIGLRKTLFYVLLPLILLGLFTFLSYAFTHQFGIIKFVLMLMPFILLLLVTHSLTKRRPLLYYLIIIDGLLLLKGLFGSIAMLF